MSTNLRHRPHGAGGKSDLKREGKIKFGVCPETLPGCLTQLAAIQQFPDERSLVSL